MKIFKFNVIKENNTQKIQGLQNSLISIDYEIAYLTADKAKQIDKVKLFDLYKNISELNKVVLDAFISKIVIGKLNSETTKRPINIDWNLYTA